MKKVLFLTLLLFISLFGFAQDTIIKYNGEIISAKITEISPTQVKYKKFDFQDGPLYIENKSDIKMIKYPNGTKEEFQKEKEQPKTLTEGTIGKDDYYGGTTASLNKIDVWGSRYKVQGSTINEKQMQKLLMDSKDKKIISLVGQAKDAHKMQYIGFAAFPLGIASLLTFANAFSVNSYNGTVSTDSGLLAVSAICFVGTVACPVVSLLEKHKRKNCNHAAIKLYNEKF